MRRLFLPALALAAAMAVPSMGVQADIATSMDATCLNVGCTQVGFTLTGNNVPAPPVGSDGWHLYQFNMRSTTGNWLFDTSAFGYNFFTISNNGTTWTTTTNPGINLGIAANALTLSVDQSLVDPLPLSSNVMYITVAFTQRGLEHELTYGGDLIYDLNTQQPQISFEGTVTPEPATLLLLGTGLLGIAGVARRRKNLQQDGEEEL